MIYSEDPNKPLEMHDIGPFGALTKRPNPKQLVVVTFPLFELMLPQLEKEAGRKFTQAEINAKLALAPAVALPKDEAERYVCAQRSSGRAQ